MCIRDRVISDTDDLAVHYLGADLLAIFGRLPDERRHFDPAMRRTAQRGERGERKLAVLVSRHLELADKAQHRGEILDRTAAAGISARNHRGMFLGSRKLLRQRRVRRREIAIGELLEQGGADRPDRPILCLLYTSRCV